jgi:O-antigen/teichoic acid export membrane protein
VTSGEDALERPLSITPPRRSDRSHLFGRGLVYVVVLSLQLVVGTVVSPVLAHLLGPADFGALASAIALHQILSVVALLGIDQALVLQRAEDATARSARGLVTVAIAISLLVSLASVLTVPLWSGALGFAHYPGLVVAVVLWTFPAAGVQAVLALLLAEDRIRAFSLVSIIAAVGGQLVGIALLLAVHNDATTYAWGGVVSQFLAMFVGVLVTRPRLRGLLDWGVTRRAIRLGVPLALGGLAYFVLTAGDRVIIQRELGASAVGRYQVAYIVGSVVILLLTFLSSAWTPRFAALPTEAARSSLARESRDELYRLLVPSIIGITLAAPIALRVVAPASFAPSSLALVVFIVALSAFPVAASAASGQLLITLRRGKTIGLIAGVAALANIALNLLLVPTLGILGAAIATLIAYALLAIAQARTLPRTAAWRRPPVTLILAVAVAIGLSAASLLLPQSLAWNIGRLVVAVACLPWFLVRLRHARVERAL